MPELPQDVQEQIARGPQPRFAEDDYTECYDAWATRIALLAYQRGREEERKACAEVKDA